jgi:ribosome biogenesis GTPase
VKPIIILSKADLFEPSIISAITDNIKARIQKLPVIAISNKTKTGYDVLENTIEKGLTYCLLGSSGVGKSTLLNNLSYRTIMRTGNISQSTKKGKHVTSHRELVILENGGILIDNPGMREVGIADAAKGLEKVFDTITSLARHCKFKDCTHTSEKGCAVIEALENAELDKNSYENYIKLEREKSHFESTLAEKRKKEKEFGKMIKNFKKDMKNHERRSD